VQRPGGESLLPERPPVQGGQDYQPAAGHDSDPASQPGQREPLLDDAIARMAKAKRAGSLETWIGRLAANSKMRDIIADRLCRRGILRPDERKILLVFRARIFPALDPAPEAAIVERLRRAIFTDADDIDDRTLVLLSLAKAANLLRLTFDRKELKARKDRIESLVQDDALGRAVHDAIEAVHVAMIVASTVT
jgi:hypothetical protein